MLQTLKHMHRRNAILAQICILRSIVTPSPIGQRSSVTSVCVCVCACLSVCPPSYLRNYTSDRHQNCCAYYLYGRGLVLLLRSSDTLCISGFMDDVIFAHKPRLLDVAAQLKRSAHAAFGLAIKCAQ